MGTLCIDRKNIEIKYGNQCLLIYEQNKRAGSIPISHLDRVVLQQQAILHSNVMGALAEQGVPLVVVNNRYPKRTAHMMNNSGNDAARRIGQYQHYLDQNWRLHWSERIVRTKLRSQRRLLHKALQCRPDKRYILHKSITTINDCIAKLPQASSQMDSIRGLEGAAAAAYFSSYTQLFAPSLQFTGRNRRPPRDPVNACLSLGYTLLHSEAVAAIHASGLDPLIGFYHDLSFGRESLACDLVEPMRSKIDSWVWRLFRERIITDNQFMKQQDACLLNKDGRADYYRHYELFAPAIRRYFRQLMQVSVKHIQAPITNNNEVH